MLSFFWFNHFLDARAEIREMFSFVFWDRTEETKISFWNPSEISWPLSETKILIFNCLSIIITPRDFWTFRRSWAYSCNLWTRSGETLFMWFRKITSPLSLSFSFTRILRNGQPSAAVFFNYLIIKHMWV